MNHIVALSLLSVVSLANASRLCPPGVPIVNCFVEPCSSAKLKGCAGYPDAECRNSYCGGCLALWFQDGKRVDCLEQKQTQPNTNENIANICPPSLPFVNCFIEPCLLPRLEGCNGYPDAVCRNDYCGGCNHYWVSNRQKVECLTSNK